MADSVETVVIGGGQAGLCTSYHLSQKGREHVVLERGRVADAWRGRWDGFYLNTPNWSLQLPGHHYDGNDPEGFAPRDEVVDYFERYANAFQAPLREGVNVSLLEPRSNGYRLQTSDGPVDAHNVVVATGAFQRPALPPPAELPDGTVQLHASEYRNPAQLASGAVLVVGTGQTGCQIGEELLRSGRRVYLSVGRCPWFPRRYRGREILHWLLEIGLMDETVDTLPSPAARLACNPALSGNDDGHDCNPLTLERESAVLLGRLERIDGGKALFAADLGQSLANAEEFWSRLKARIDAFAGDDGPGGDGLHTRANGKEMSELDLQGSGIGTVLWANGFRPDFGWIRLPIFDEYGWPVQVRGVSEAPGLYFVGLHWLHKRKSALLIGVGEDAEYVASQIASTAA